MRIKYTYENRLTYLWKGDVHLEKFMDENFLLDTETAKKLFHEFCENMPIWE